MKKFNKNKMFISSFILFATLFSCQSDTKDEGIKTEDTIPVSVISLQQEKGNTIIETTGLFTTDDETLLSFKNGGIIEKIYVKEGDMVKQGQLLAVLNLAELQAKATQAKLAIEKAERDFKRAEKLYKDSVATLEQYENAKTYLEVVKEDWKTIQFNLRYSEIRANTDGYVLLRLANEGQIVGPGTPILQINGAKKGKWLVKVGVSDLQWSKISEGDSALITADAFSDKIPAKVYRKSEGLNPNSGTFTIHIQPNYVENLKLASGMFAKVKIFGNASDLWSIPYDAILDGDAEKAYVFVTDDQKTAKKIEVKISGLNKETVQISQGLENHEKLIVIGGPYLKDGAKIKIVGDL